MTKLKVDIIDEKAVFTRIAESLREVNELYVVVGVPKGAEDRKDAKDPSMAEVAFFNEFGTEHIPERSFLRSTVDENSRKYTELYRKLMGSVYDGKTTIKKAMGVLGEKARADVRAKIRSNVPPPNAPATIARKKSTKTLVDTGQLRQSITYEVRDGKPDGSEV